MILRLRMCLDCGVTGRERRDGVLVGKEENSEMEWAGGICREE